MLPRLKRLDRIFGFAPTYFVTACTYDRHELLANAAVHQAFIRFSERASGRGVFVGIYILMPDHLHLFVTFDPASDMTLGPWVKSLKNALSKAIRDNGLEAPHWQKGFFDHVLRSEESAVEKWTYVQANAVRAGLVPRECDWPYVGDFALENRQLSDSAPTGPARSK